MTKAGGAGSGGSSPDDVDAQLEDFFLYFGLAFLMLLLSMATYFFSKMKASTGDTAQEQPQAANNARPQINRRQAAVRNRRTGRRVQDSDSEGEQAAADRGRAGGAAQRHSDGSDHEVDMDERLNDPKLGAKKRAKLEMKAEKRAQREAEERMREDRKVRQAKEDNERMQREQQEADEEKKKEEEEKRLREEKAKREHEEYLKMKEMFSVEEEGCDVIEEEEEGNLIEKFINHIKAQKVILFEELATQFGLKVQDTIDRLTVLVSEGRLTGVMDDRGKFIYISEEELKNFAKFVKQRGRVSISDLVENSSSLITLQSETPITA